MALKKIAAGYKDMDPAVLEALPHYDRHGALFEQQKLESNAFPGQMNNPQQIKSLIKDKLMLDGNAKLNLATFCQTEIEKDVRDLMDLCIDKNMIDKDEYPNTAELELRCVKMLGELWHNPDAEAAIGCSTVGSSEACMLGGLAMKKKWSENLYAKMEKEQGKKIDKKRVPLPAKPNMICGPVQVCWHKFGEYFDVDMRECELKRSSNKEERSNKYVLEAEDIKELADENTIGVAVTLGNTMVLVYEDVEAISNALDELEKEKGWNIPIHIDGASGGFLAPFLNYLPEDVGRYNIDNDKPQGLSTIKEEGSQRTLNKQETMDTAYRSEYLEYEKKVKCGKGVTREDYEYFLAHHPSFSEPLVWDFKIPRVKSISASGHKYGLAPLGAGWIIWREPSDLHEDLQFRVNYLGGDMPTIALNFSRPGGQVVSQYYNFMRYGWAGYYRIHRLCANLAIWFAMELHKLRVEDKNGKEIKLFQIIFPTKNYKGIPGVCWNIDPAARESGIYGANEYDLSDRLRIQGWQVPAYTLCPKLDDEVVMRILIKEGSSLDLLGYLVKSIKEAIEFFKKHPVVHSQSHEEGQAFHH